MIQAPEGLVHTTQSRFQIVEDRSHQRHQWRFERIGWVLMAALLAAGLLGLLGYGPLSRAHAGKPGALTLQYDRLQRSSAPTEYRFEAAPSLVRDGRLRLRFDDALLDEVEMQSIIPQPTEMRTGPGYIEFVFAMDAGKGSPAHIQFQFKPATFGHVRGRITADGTAPLVVDQIVYP